MAEKKIGHPKEKYQVDKSSKENKKSAGQDSKKEDKE